MTLGSSRAVLVTGGGTGIGAAVARQLTEAGDQVAILGRRAGLLASVAASTGAVDVVCDVSDAGQVSAAVSSVVGRFGRLDGLVLNAGVMVPGGVGDLSLADWDTLVAVNLTGAFLVARAALPFLLEARGAVVSVASVAALRASAEMGGYAVTKAGLVMLTQSLAVDHAHQGLRANVVCPGWTVTEMARGDPGGRRGHRGGRRHAALRSAGRRAALRRGRGALRVGETPGDDWG